MDSILIQCPECPQRFKVKPDFIGKMVECGSCDAQFRISTEHVQDEHQKTYPGEKQKVGYRNFRKAGEIAEQPVSFQTAHYESQARIEDALPMGPRRKMAITIAFAILTIFTLLFTIGHSAISDITTNNRFLLAGVISVIAFGLLIYGARRAIVTLLMGLLLIGILCSAPLFFQYSEPPVRQGIDSNLEQLAEIEAAFEAPTLNKVDLGYDKVEEAMNKDGASPDSVVAYALYGYKETNEDLLTRYLYDAYGRRDYPLFYKERLIGEKPVTLIVISKVDIDSLSVAANHAANFGKVEKIHRDLRLIEVTVDQEKIEGDPESHYMSESSPHYFAANLRELSHIDYKRRINALTRLAGASTHKKRVDYVRKLIDMLKEKQTEEDTNLIIQVLNRWSFPEDNIQNDVFQAIEGLLENYGNIKMETMAYLVEQNVPGKEDILAKVWAAKPVQWQAAIVATGDLGRRAILKIFPEINVAQMSSAASILREIGTKADLATMEASLEYGDENSRIVMKATIDEIKSRQ